MSKATTRSKRFKKVEKILFLHPKCTQTSYKKLDEAIESIKGDKYYPIIDLHYFKQMKFEEVIAATGFAKQTVYKHRDRLICRIIDTLYADEVMKEIMETKEDV
ncbi:MAG: hypothetical protein ACLRL6_08240 [Clostridium sp.]